MPVFQLGTSIRFPLPEYAEQDGLLAIGGDLSPERLLHAYKTGIFPWYNVNEPILWWSPDPRFVLFPHKLKISKSMKQILRQELFTITFDQDFEAVVDGCSKPRRNGDGTWITSEMKEAYLALHKLGLAHSVEAWRHGKLVGGLYGVSLGKCYFGESMFAKESNASKAAFITLIEKLKKQNFELIDCQLHTRHLESLGAENLARKEFLNLLKKNLANEDLTGNWNELLA